MPGDRAALADGLSGSAGLSRPHHQPPCPPGVPAPSEGECSHSSGPDSGSLGPLQTAFFTQRQQRVNNNTRTYRVLMGQLQIPAVASVTTLRSWPLWCCRGLAQTPSSMRDRCMQRPIRWWSASGLPGATCGAVPGKCPWFTDFKWRAERSVWLLLLRARYQPTESHD